MVMAIIFLGSIIDHLSTSCTAIEEIQYYGMVMNAWWVGYTVGWMAGWNTERRMVERILSFGHLSGLLAFGFTLKKKSTFLQFTSIG